MQRRGFTLRSITSFGVGFTAPAFMAALALIATGCSTSSVPKSAQDNIIAQPNVIADNVNATWLAKPFPAERVSPLDDLLGEILGTNLPFEEFKTKYQQEIIRHEELVAQCMTEAGFDYIPAPSEYEIADASVRNPAYRPDVRDWVAQYGFAQIVYPAEMMAPCGVIIDPPANPNQDYINSLSPAERDAYWATLIFPQFDSAPGGVTLADGTFLTDNEFQDYLTNSTCNGRASRIISEESPAGLTESAEFAPLFTAISDLRTRLWEEATEADYDWGACMADKGFPDYARPIEARNQFGQEVNDALDRISKHWDYSRDLNTANSPELAELHNREIDIALADFDCRVSVNHQARKDAHETAAELQFIEDYRPAFNALRAAAEQRS